MSPSIATILRDLQDAARHHRFEPVGSVTATDVQTAIQQVGAIIGEIGVVNGIATLDGSGKLTSSQIPDPVVASVAGKTGAVKPVKNVEIVFSHIGARPSRFSPLAI